MIRSGTRERRDTPILSPLYRPSLNGPKSAAHEYLSFPLLLCPSNEVLILSGCRRTKSSTVGLPFSSDKWNPPRSPEGHLREFVTLGPGPNMLSTVYVDNDGYEDETGDVQVVVWRDLFSKRRRELRVQVVEVTKRLSKWNGTKNLIATDLSAVRAS